MTESISYGWLDSLTKSLGSLKNSVTGFNTTKDPNIYTTIAPDDILTSTQLDHLYESETFIQSVVDLLPQDGVEHFEWKFDTPEIKKAFKNKFSKQLRGIHKTKNAATQGRLHGDGFLLLGIEDGKSFEDPVDLNEIQDLQWLLPLNRHDLSILDVNRFDDPEFYQIATHKINTISPPSEQINTNLEPVFNVHRDRIIRFPGKQIYGISLEHNCGFNQSVIQAFYNKLVPYLNAFMAAGSMIVDHSVFLYKINGLTKQIVNQKDDVLTKRFQGLATGRSVLNALILDKQMEDADFINKQYNGVDKILNHMLDVVIASSGLPRSKLLGSSNSSNFSEGGASDEKEWAKLVKSYQHFFLREPLERLTDIIVNSQAFEFTGANYELIQTPTLKLDDQDKAEIEERQARADAIYLDRGVLTPQSTAKRRFVDLIDKDIVDPENLSDEPLNTLQSPGTQNNTEPSGNNNVTLRNDLTNNRQGLVNQKT